uniref:(northern house mosquito) hypothetical protein n=1 Tax=Culex pipiens TaxID=7175 RepID=A0A8D8P2S4_CULPI
MQLLRVEVRQRPVHRVAPAVRRRRRLQGQVGRNVRHVRVHPVSELRVPLPVRRVRRRDGHVQRGEGVRGQLGRTPALSGVQRGVDHAGELLKHGVPVSIRTVHLQRWSL